MTDEVQSNRPVGPAQRAPIALAFGSRIHRSRHQPQKGGIYDPCDSCPEGKPAGRRRLASSEPLCGRIQTARQILQVAVWSIRPMR